jgi:DNA repair exonuclease SbcCD ATPase subunit
MQIISLTVENIKKVKAVKIVPSGNLVQITGGNGAGKSSVLDSIYYALAGTANLPSQPIRKGQEKASIKLDLGEIVVTRKFTATGTTLTVEATNGARFPSPQRMLDDLLGSLTFDPLAFMRQAAKEQLATLRGLVKLEVDVDVLNQHSANAYEQRTALNREIKQLEAQAAAISFPEGTPNEPIDVMALVKDLNKAGEFNSELEKRRGLREGIEQGIERKDKTLEETFAEIKRLQQKAEKLEESIIADRKAFDALEPLPEPIKTAALQEKIKAAQDTNICVTAKARQAEIVDRLRVKRELADTATELIRKNTDSVAAAIAAAEMPVEGLAFGDGEVLYGGLPLSQAASSEQLRISAAIAMSGNPKLRVLRIKDGSLLDEKSLIALEQMATLGDYQMWVERVDTSGKIGVVIEDGEVK